MSSNAGSDHQSIADNYDAESVGPPSYTVDLSLPPERRFDHIANDLREELNAIHTIYKNILSQLRPLPKPLLMLTSRLMFRRLYDDEENREIRGISKATGVPHYLLVAYNVLLDLFMGCTSGGVRVRDEAGGTRMLHFRTLDWNMDELRKLVVILNFVEYADGPVVASSITYFGYVGVLTGLRRGLSLSLNFRPNHDRSSMRKRLAFRTHQILVLLGRRRSIASSLRQCLLPKDRRDRERTPREIAETLQPQKSTAAYLTFSDGNTTVCMDNDHKKARIIESSDFAFLMNHDYVDEMTQKIEELRLQHGIEGHGYLEDDVLEKSVRLTGFFAKLSGARDVVEISIVRRERLERLWARDRVHVKGTERDFCISGEAIQRWMEEGWELVNELTHYGVIMDPMEGKILWLERYLEPLEFNTLSDSEEDAQDASRDIYPIDEVDSDEDVRAGDHSHEKSSEMKQL